MATKKGSASITVVHQSDSSVEHQARLVYQKDASITRWKERRDSSGGHQTFNPAGQKVRRQPYKLEDAEHYRGRVRRCGETGNRASPRR